MSSFNAGGRRMRMLLIIWAMPNLLLLALGLLRETLWRGSCVHKKRKATAWLILIGRKRGRRLGVGRG
jgi:hypothetical protein